MHYVIFIHQSVFFSADVTASTSASVASIDTFVDVNQYTFSFDSMRDSTLLQNGTALVRPHRSLVCGSSSFCV